MGSEEVEMVTTETTFNKSLIGEQRKGTVAEGTMRQRQGCFIRKERRY